MADSIIVYKDRTNVVTISLGYSVFGDVITSEIRTASGTLIVTWTVEFDGDGSNGELILTLDDSLLGDIPYTNGLMDLKRMTGGEPVSIFDESLEVEFREVITQ